MRPEFIVALSIRMDASSSTTLEVAGARMLMAVESQHANSIPVTISTSEKLRFDLHQAVPMFNMSESS